MTERFSMFTVLISSISRHIRKIKSMEVAEYDLKGPHVTCLYYIYKQENLTAKELCDLTGEDKGAISRSLDFLEENGFIIVQDVEGKKYKTPLVLTEKGASAAEGICKKIDGILDEVSEGVSDGERVIMYRSLEAINKNLQAICEKYED